MEAIRVKFLRPGASLPTYGTPEAAGADLYACLTEPVSIEPGTTAFIPTGIALEVPKGCAGLIYARSGMACKRGLAPANKVGVVERDERGEIERALYNDGAEVEVSSQGDRIDQFLITPVVTAAYEVAKELSDTARNAGGFGSTGK